MTSRLSTDAMARLTPLLGSLARMVARGLPVNESQLQTLLLGADLESDTSALEELKRWGRLLTILREQPTEENRHATVEALMLRGLPEATVLLAVDAVTEGRQSTRSSQRLSANVEQLEFGILSPGQGASAELEVQGGPGQVVVTSDQLRVWPLQFGPGPTRLRVEVKPLSSGVLWTSLKLVAPGESLEIPVLAQWMETDIGIIEHDYEPEGQKTESESESDLRAQIDQLLGITAEPPPPTETHPSSERMRAGEEDILRQLRQLLDET